MNPSLVILMILIIGFFSFTLGRAFQRDRNLFPRTTRILFPGDKRPLTGILATGSLIFALFAAATIDSNYNSPHVLTTLGFLSYWLLLPVWVYQDARSRGERAWAWGLMTLFTNVMGLISYLIIRPEKTQTCKRCGYKLREDFAVCPYCGPEAGRACSNCKSMLELDWLYCPYCRASVDLYSDANDGPLEIRSS
jgi:RNA polymerase subunit RPABC4/transcription elongation factor Spt4